MTNQPMKLDEELSAILQCHTYDDRCSDHLKQLKSLFSTFCDEVIGEDILPEGNNRFQDAVKYAVNHEKENQRQRKEELLK